MESGRGLAAELMKHVADKRTGLQQFLPAVIEAAYAILDVSVYVLLSVANVSKMKRAPEGATIAKRDLR